LVNAQKPGHHEGARHGNPQKITTYLWFDGNAEQAVEYYTSLFPDSRVTKVARWGKGGPAPEGSILNIVFELAGQSFIALNGGPQFKFTPAISLFVSCESQAEGSGDDLAPVCVSTAESMSMKHTDLHPGYRTYVKDALAGTVPPSPPHNPFGTPLLD
jgi:uncharacterized glyoxalase superfamily protein PhnB